MGGTHRADALSLIEGWGCFYDGAEEKEEEEEEEEDLTSPLFNLATVELRSGLICIKELGLECVNFFVAVVARRIKWLLCMYYEAIKMYLFFILMIFFSSSKNVK